MEVSAAGAAVAVDAQPTNTKLATVTKLSIAKTTLRISFLLLQIIVFPLK
jgi:hypothetical protein